ncbi:hypothetical protein Tco_1563194 [Tanacetum coccineum]
MYPRRCSLQNTPMKKEYVPPLPVPFPKDTRALMKRICFPRLPTSPPRHPHNIKEGGEDGGGAWDGGVGCGGTAAGEEEEGKTRVRASDHGERVDPVVRTTFGFDRKSPPEKFSGGGRWWPAVVGGGRIFGEEGRGRVLYIVSANRSATSIDISAFSTSVGESGLRGDLTDLFYLRGLDGAFGHVPYFLAKVFEIVAAGRKSGAYISGGQICVEIDDTWAWLPWDREAADSAD